MSITHEIERNHWGRYLDQLSRKELKHPVHIEVEGDDIGDEEMTRQLPFMGVSLDRKGSASGAVDIVVGRQADGEIIDHRISRADRLYVQETDDGRIECLDIEDSDNHKTLVYFD